MGGVGAGNAAKTCLVRAACHVSVDMQEQRSELVDIRDEKDCYSHQFIIPTNSDMSADRLPVEAGKPGYRAGDGSLSLIIKSCILKAEKSCTYLCGNSLGLLPRRSAELVKEELEVWGTRCVA